MQDEALTEILSKTEIAQGLEQADLELVLAHSQVETVDAGTTVIAEGQIATLQERPALCDPDRLSPRSAQ